MKLKMNLGTKIGGGFGLLILIAILLGGIAVFNMKHISKLSTMLDAEYLPALEAANQMERSYLQAIFTLRGYNYTLSNKFLEEGRGHLAAMDKQIEDARKLAARSPHLEGMEGQVDKIQASADRYRQSLDETVAMAAKQAANIQDMYESAQVYMESCQAVLDYQVENMGKQIKAGDTPENLTERFLKVTLVNDIMQLGHVTRQDALRFRAENNPKVIEDAQKNFDLMAGKFAELRKITVQRGLLDKIDDSLKAGKRFQQAMNNYLANWRHLQKLGENRVTEAGIVLGAAQGTANDSVKHTKEIAGTTVSSLGTASTIMVTGLGIALLLGCAIAFLITRSITKPVNRTVEMLDEMEQGRLNTRLKLESADEIGQMARTMDRFADSLQHEVVASLQKLANGDLTFDITPKDERDLIRGALKRLGEDLNQVMSQVQVAGEQIASGSSQVSDSSQSLSQGATEQASSLEEISSSMTEMGSQTKQNADNATQASSLASQARNAAEKGNEQMQEMMTAMNEINASGQNISKIIKVIDEIAFQTNLLALNAAVEAARAGQHGKGFAVVAEEVRNLAARSAKAARETADLIEGSVHKAENGVQIAQRTAEALDEIVTGVGKTTDLVAEIAAASNEQAQGIGQISQALSQIESVVQQNTANAEESAAASEELAGQADQLRQLLEQFKLKGQQIRNQMALPGQKKAAANGSSRPKNGAPRLHNGDAEPSIVLDDAEFGKY